MNKIRFLSLLIFILVYQSISTTVFAQAPDWLWVKREGASSNDYAASVTTDATGNIIVVGYFQSSTLNFGSTTLVNVGNLDLFVVKYDASGNVLWAKSAGGTRADWAYSVSTDTSGNVYLAGWFSSDTLFFDSISLINDNTNWNNLFIAKYDADGNLRWAKSAGGTGDDEAVSVATDNYGNIFITGYFGSDTIAFGSNILINTNPGNTKDVFLTKYDTDGNVLWAKSLVGAGNDYGNSVATDKIGNIYIAGSFSGPTLIFDSTETIMGNSDIFLAKYNSAGDILWAKNPTGAYSDKATAVATDTSENVFITGYFQSPTLIFGSTVLTNSNFQNEIFLAKYDYTGNFLWAKSVSGTDDDEVFSVATDASGNSYITGYFFSSTLNFSSNTLSNTGASDIFLAKYDVAGNVLFAKSASGTEDDLAKSVCTDNVGNVFVTGFSISPVLTFDAFTLTSAGHNDMFLAKLNSVVTNTSENSFVKENILIYPNPSIGILTIKDKTPGGFGFVRPSQQSSSIVVVV